MPKYIDKDALVAELKKRISDYWGDSENTMGIYPYALEDVIKYINGLEAKDVDLEKEIQSWIEDNSVNGYYREDVYETAEHFYELGMQAQTKKCL